MLRKVKGIILIKGCYGSGKTQTGLRLIVRLFACDIWHRLSTAASQKTQTAAKVEEQATSQTTKENEKNDTSRDPKIEFLPHQDPDEEQPVRVLWTTESNLNVDSSAHRLFEFCKLTKVNIRIVRAYALQGEKESVRGHYVQEEIFDPLPVSEQFASEFLLEARIRDKARATLDLHASGDKRRRLTNLSLSQAMIQELEADEDDDTRYQTLRSLFLRVEKNAEDL
ncbi:hypothetical protein ONS95_005179 [Cadophora gregata]|uniref:uncharacterized protein n=1 Tax=Cadophora gregata TaxID=51156 RepID=UPI0026DDC7D3|nr:uncharacterized protein ONS95_005179 [Cadophora gregata]KAK0104916.1 hypothetical protein ONS95_005179 [Cadophora gregata]KAK0115003.1 hypothetical protein ONS96_013476 [Cadophora gregata f. sp. sojae]